MQVTALCKRPHSQVFATVQFLIFEYCKHDFQAVPASSFGSLSVCKNRVQVIKNWSWLEKAWEWGYFLLRSHSSWCSTALYNHILSPITVRWIPGYSLDDCMEPIKVPMNGFAELYYKCCTWDSEDVSMCYEWDHLCVYWEVWMMQCMQLDVYWEWGSACS